MNSIVRKCFFYLLLLITTTSFIHPLKLTTSLLDYDAPTKTLKMECRVFIDDFEKSINRTLKKNINVSNLTAADKKGLQDYFTKYYKITLNGKKLLMKFKSAEALLEFNVLNVKFTGNSLAFKKGDKLLIENTLFFSEFGYQQTNRVSVKILPYFNYDEHELTLENYSIPLTLY